MQKRRLPVLRPAPEEESGEPPRPPWHWIGFGTVATFVVWLPLAYVAEAIKARLLTSLLGDHATLEETAAALRALSGDARLKVALLVFGVPLVPLLVGSWAGGYLVGRWGGEAATVREAALAGLATGLLVAGLTCASVGGAWAGVAIVVPTTGLAALGGWMGVRRRIAGRTPNIR